MSEGADRGGCGGKPSWWNSLTKRQRQVSSLLAEGSSAKDIAATLNIKVSTVNVHLRNIYEKTGLTRVPLIRAMLLVSPPREEPGAEQM